MQPVRSIDRRSHRCLIGSNGWNVSIGTVYRIKTLTFFMRAKVMRGRGFF